MPRSDLSRLDRSRDDGLKPDTDVIIEMATIVTDANSCSWPKAGASPIHQPDSVLDAMDGLEQAHARCLRVAGTRA
jgi:oligoribonuclease (3'-5' exoribonuclease)